MNSLLFNLCVLFAALLCVSAELQFDGELARGPLSALVNPPFEMPGHIARKRDTKAVLNHCAHDALAPPVIGEEEIFRTSFYKTTDGVCDTECGTQEPFHSEEVLWDYCTSQEGQTWFTYEWNVTGVSLERCIWETRADGGGDSCCIKGDQTASTNMEYSCLGSDLKIGPTSCTKVLFSVHGDDTVESCASAQKVQQVKYTQPTAALPQHFLLEDYSDANCQTLDAHFDLEQAGGLQCENVANLVGEVNGFIKIESWKAGSDGKPDTVRICLYYDADCGVSNGHAPFKCIVYSVVGECVSDGTKSQKITMTDIVPDNNAGVAPHIALSVLAAAVLSLLVLV